MNRNKVLERNQEIITFLTTPNEHGIKPTLDEAGDKFNLSQGHVFRIKKALIGLNSND